MKARSDARFRHNSTPFTSNLTGDKAMARHMQKFTMYSLSSEPQSSSAAVLACPAPEEFRGIQESSLRRIIEQVPGILWTTDLDLNIAFSLGNSLARLNPVVRPHEGMPLGEFFGDESVHSPVLDAHYNALGGHAQSFEIDVDGTIFWGMVEPLFNADWNLIGTVGSAVEITGRKEAEVERIRQVMREHEADKRQALTELAAGITQHFGKLFNSISACAAIVGMSLPQDHPALRWLENIENAAQCATDLAEQVLSAELPVSAHVENVPLTSLIERHLEVYRALLPKKTALHVDLDREDTAVVGDPDDVRRLLVNLVCNAATAIGDEEGTVTLRTQVTQAPPLPLFEQNAINNMEEREYLWLQVSDTSRGLDEDARHRIFQPSTGFSGRSIGMGPALAIIARMHGAMSISSKPGLGTTYHVFLPAAHGNGAAPPAPECFF